MESDGNENTRCSAKVSSTTPNPEARCPPFRVVTPIIKARSSSANAFNCRRFNFLTSEGVLMSDKTSFSFMCRPDAIIFSCVCSFSVSFSVYELQFCAFFVFFRKARSFSFCIFFYYAHPPKKVNRIERILNRNVFMKFYRYLSENNIFMLLFCAKK